MELGSPLVGSKPSEIAREFEPNPLPFIYFADVGLASGLPAQTKKKVLISFFLNIMSPLTLAVPVGTITIEALYMLLVTGEGWRVARGLLGGSPASVKRDWATARVWLHREMRGA